ncbi:hypothetical protein ACCO45_001076 [Purpureocillium lilacinum]|uniref:Uncharacterized protein n=1 Tax=Purpureocillium lilacinum TaxID=33203 RepID=A0ACC4E620_PURLI
MHGDVATATPACPTHSRTLAGRDGVSAPPAQQTSVNHAMHGCRWASRGRQTDYPPSAGRCSTSSTSTSIGCVMQVPLQSSPGRAHASVHSHASSYSARCKPARRQTLAFVAGSEKLPRLRKVVMNTPPAPGDVHTARQQRRRRRRKEAWPAHHGRRSRTSQSPG